MAVLALNVVAGDRLSTRLLASLPLAVVITVALFLLMRFMIDMQFDLRPVEKTEVFTIKPVVVELEVRQPREMPQRVDDITPPPPPPRILNQNAAEPSEAITALTGTLPKLEPSNIKSKTINFRIADTGVLPLIRIAPIYPQRALERGLEGDCTAVFDVSSEGKPYNILATCTHQVFVSAVKRVIQKWKYQPRVVNGVAVVRTGVGAPVSFRMVDD